MPLNSTDEQIRAFHDKCAAHKVTGYAVGPIYMKSEEEIDRAFDYAKRVGVKLIVGVPNYELLPYVDKKVKEYDFHYAIHLHGPDIKTYPDATDVWEHTKDLDPRIGMCLDVGHDLRNGCDPVADLKKIPYPGVRYAHQGRDGFFEGGSRHRDRSWKDRLPCVDPYDAGS